MKKYFVLTSVLALAACGGGGSSSSSGINHSPVSSITVPDELEGRVSATESNSKITSMKSEVVVSSNSNASLSRVAHTYTDENGVTFKSYRLDDIKLYVAEAGQTDNGYLQIGMNEDTGRIESMKMVTGGVGAPVARDGEDKRFYGPIFEYVADGDDRAIFRMPDTGQDAAALAAKKTELVEAGKDDGTGHWVLINETMDVITSGEDVGLQYSDFGHFNPVYRTKYKNAETLNDSQLAQARAGNSLGRGDSLDKIKDTDEFNAELGAEDYQLFAGGYAVKGMDLVESLDVPKKTTFKGTAIGRVYTSIQGGNYDARRARFDVYGIEDTGSPDDGHDIAKAYKTNNATMTIDKNGKQTLYMPFYSKSANSDKYYDVTLVKNTNGTVTSSFVAANEDAIGAEYRKYDALEHVTQAEFNPGYYGVNTATEAAGTARMYSEHDFGDGTKREYEVQAAYGMKKQ